TPAGQDSGRALPREGLWRVSWPASLLLLSYQAGRAPRLSCVAPRAEATPVSGAVRLVVLLILVETVERPGAGADHAPDPSALAGALAASRDGAARRADRGAHDRADGRVLHRLRRLVTLAHLGRRVTVAGVDHVLRGDGGARAHGRRRGHGRRLGGRAERARRILGRLGRLPLASGPVRDDDARYERRRQHE